jgi:hypothetical protein
MTNYAFLTFCALTFAHRFRWAAAILARAALNLRGRAARMFLCVAGASAFVCTSLVNVPERTPNRA